MAKARSIKERLSASQKAISALADCHPDDVEQIVSYVLDQLWQFPASPDAFSTTDMLNSDARLWATTSSDRVLDAYLGAASAEIERRRKASAERAAFARLHGTSGTPPPKAARK